MVIYLTDDHLQVEPLFTSSNYAVATFTFTILLQSLCLVSSFHHLKHSMSKQSKLWNIQTDINLYENSKSLLLIIYNFKTCFLIFILLSQSTIRFPFKTLSMCLCWTRNHHVISNATLYLSLQSTVFVLHSSGISVKLLNSLAAFAQN